MLLSKHLLSHRGNVGIKKKILIQKYFDILTANFVRFLILLIFLSVLFFKSKLVTQVFITNMRVKNMCIKEYTLKRIHIEINILAIKTTKFSFEYVFIWIYIRFNMYSFWNLQIFELYTCKVQKLQTSCVNNSRILTIKNQNLS